MMKVKARRNKKWEKDEINRRKVVVVIMLVILCFKQSDWIAPKERGKVAVKIFQWHRENEEKKHLEIIYQNRL